MLHNSFCGLGVKLVTMNLILDMVKQKIIDYVRISGDRLIM